MPLIKKPGKAAPITLPTTLAGRVEFVMNLLRPTVVVTCPACGHERTEAGAPLISKENAIEMLDLPELEDATDKTSG